MQFDIQHAYSSLLYSTKFLLHHRAFDFVFVFIIVFGFVFVFLFLFIFFVYVHIPNAFCFWFIVYHRTKNIQKAVDAINVLFLFFGPAQIVLPEPSGLHLSSVLCRVLITLYQDIFHLIASNTIISFVQVLNPYWILLIHY